MKYQLLIISRIETDQGDQLAVLTFFPDYAASVRARPYEKILATYAHAFPEGVELAETVSHKGRKRIKLLLRRPTFTDDERRQRGDAYYATVFGRSCGNDEEQKGIADALYQTMLDLYAADLADEDAWTLQCEEAAAMLIACQV